MGNIVRLRVWADFAMFTRVESKVERVSYDAITPSAARGVLESVYWKPQMRWEVFRIHVRRPIRFVSLGGNGVKDKIGAGVARAMKSGHGSLGVDVSDDAMRVCSSALFLRDVEYVIEARADLRGPASPEGGGAPAEKHVAMFERRARKGQFFRAPYLGTRECMAYFELADAAPEPSPDVPDRELGWMPHDAVYVEDPAGPVIESHAWRRARREQRFFQARIANGAIEVPPLPERRASV